MFQRALQLPLNSSPRGRDADLGSILPRCSRSLRLERKLLFSLHSTDAPLGVEVLAHPWPRVLLYAFHHLALMPRTLARVREHGLGVILVAPCVF